MNMSIARAGRPATRTLSVVAAAVATVSLLAACASGTGTTAGSTDDESTAAAAAADVTVIDQTNLLLATAQETLEARGLEVLVADSSGQGRTIDDPTQWVVVTQNPITGTVEPGTEVTLTVRMTTDPAN